ncbi:tRNA (uracil-5-)-methyltransferase homolog B [Aplochiton taeniatus]
MERQEQEKSLSKKKTRTKFKKPILDESLSWEQRLADAATPLWRLSYNEQLNIKQKQQERILLQIFKCNLSNKSAQTQAPPVGKLNFPVFPIIPSPDTEGYRNKSTFSVNRGVDGNPKTVGLYVGTGKAGNILCVNGDHLINMPEKHKLVARCYQNFIRISPLDPCLLFHSGGHWREVTVRTNAQGHTMAIVYFHPQKLNKEEIGNHKGALIEYFIQGPGSVCRLDSLYFQESSMTRCSHNDSPYQLLYGQQHIYEETILLYDQQHIHEEVLGFKFRISADAFFQVNRGAAELLYKTVRDICLPDGQTKKEERTGEKMTLLDVCCGTGAIGITMSSRVDRVIGIELIEQAVQDARHNAALNSVLNCEFMPGRAEVVLPGLMSPWGSSEGSVTAVVNPARAGLHHRVIRAIRNHPSIRRLLYISCKPEGDAMRNFRELCCEPDPKKKLTGQAFAPRLAVPVDMFPHTPHSELILLFER